MNKQWIFPFMAHSTRDKTMALAMGISSLKWLLQWVFPPLSSGVSSATNLDGEPWMENP
jgi:hypothetical protein